jgi:O-antigen ligase
VGASEYLIGASHLSLIQYKYLKEPVHNIFFLILSEAGIFGCIGISLLFVKAIKKTFREKSSYLAVVMFFVIVYGSSDHFFLTQQQGRLLLGLVLGIIFTKQNVGKPINENYSKKG